MGLFTQEFTVDGPDLYVYLSQNMNIEEDGLGEYVSLAKLKASSGNQNYSLLKILRSIIQW